MKEKIKVLVVEDNDLDYTLICKSIISDYNIDRAKTLKESLVFIKNNTYNVIVLDLNLPDSKMIETFREIKAKALSVPIIITTSIESPEVSKEAAEDGCFFLFQKNELPNQLFDRAIQFANIYYGSEHERAARGTSVALRNLKNFFNK